jgi:dTDP-glucose pyrophosphorylase
MKSWKNLIVSPETSIRQTIGVIDEGRVQIALVADKKLHLKGTVTDGDIRRGILKGVSLEEPVRNVMNHNPVAASQDNKRAKILERMKNLQLKHIPIVDWRNRLVDIEIYDGLRSLTRDNWVLIMAGGQGTRLRPFTDVFPKPLLPVGQKPLLETMIENLIEAGFGKFFISVNYKARMIEEYIGDGRKWGVKIKYLHEKKPLGTAGALTLLPRSPTHPVLVINGDILTKISFRDLLDFHAEHAAKATMCVREYDFQIPYGVVKMEKHRINGIHEKPTERFFINAGIYVLDPSVLKMVPKKNRFDMTTLYNRMLRKQLLIAAFPIREYWMDIGQISDFRRANEDFEETSK